MVHNGIGTRTIKYRMSWESQEVPLTEDATYIFILWGSTRASGNTGTCFTVLKVDAQECVLCFATPLILPTRRLVTVW